MEDRRQQRGDSSEKIAVVDHLEDDEETEYNAIDAQDDEDDYGEEDGDWDSKMQSNGLNPQHLIRLLRTQSNKGAAGGTKFQRTMARMMSEVFQATLHAAEDVHSKTVVRQASQSDTTGELEKLLKQFMAQVQMGGLPLGTMGAGGAGGTFSRTNGGGATSPINRNSKLLGSTLMNAQAQFDPTSNISEKVLKEIGYLKAEVQTLKVNQQGIMEQLKEQKRNNIASVDSLLESQAEILAVIKGTKYVRKEQQQPVMASVERQIRDDQYDLNVENRVQEEEDTSEQLVATQKTGTFTAKPYQSSSEEGGKSGQTKTVDLTMSVGSNLLAMLNDRQSIQTSSKDDSQDTNEDESAGDKNASQHSAQMRKCMKNFNFKLDYNEIDRIIEEQDDGLAGAGENNQRNNPETTSQVPPPAQSKAREEVKQTFEPSPRHVKPSQRRKQWGQHQEQKTAAAAAAEEVSPRVMAQQQQPKAKSGPGVRINRNVSALQSSSNDPILQLLKKEAAEAESQDLPLQIKGGTDESPIIGGHHSALQQQQQQARQQSGKGGSAAVENGMAAARPRPMLGGVANNKQEEQKKGGNGSKRTGPGFGGFKAPPSTDLIDQLLLEQDQDSIKLNPKPKEGKPRAGGFGGLKAPAGKTDLLDQLLKTYETNDDNEIDESIKDDGRPAQLKKHNYVKDGIERTQSERVGMGVGKHGAGVSNVGRVKSEQQDIEKRDGQISHRRKNSEKSEEDEQALNFDELDDDDSDGDNKNPFSKNKPRRPRVGSEDDEQSEFWTQRVRQNAAPATGNAKANGTSGTGRFGAARFE